MPDVLTAHMKRGADGLVEGERRRGLLRRWSVAHSRMLEGFYSFFNAILPYVRPVIEILPERFAEKLFRAIERPTKHAAFGCHMCGTCILSATGMACPMNCPKNLRNGPCGGVRADASAWFNRVQVDAATDRRFDLRLLAFDGNPAEVGARYVAGTWLAQQTVMLDSAAFSWQQVQASLALPPNTSYVLVEIYAFEDQVNDADGAEFAGHYADELSLVLVRP